LGGPAGLQRHVIRNHTRVKLPQPAQNFSIDVRQTPGFSYPPPVNHVRIHERTTAGPGIFHQPLDRKREVIVPGACTDGGCIIDPMASPADAGNPGF
jgi:hypothetical protein